jgi:cysteine-rich repeat protein
MEHRHFPTPAVWIRIAAAAGLLVFAGCDETDPTDAGVDASALADAGPAVLCGDGTVVPGAEGCDDGNTTAGDGCSATCTIEEGFSCVGSPSDCEAECSDGIVASTEDCDDGNRIDGDGCGAGCNVEDGYACSGAPSVCDAVCGDGELLGAEACDDGNTEAEDGCSATCAVEEGFACTGEPSECDGICGDSLIRGTEGCDDGSRASGDGCAGVCQIETGFVCTGEPSVCAPDCGDGLPFGDEECDDGNDVDGDGCTLDCTIEDGFLCEGRPSVCTGVCGDGNVVFGEGCDDGNTTPGDGCDATCAVERGFACMNEPGEASVCDDTCGDGVTSALEGCDDGNMADGDGCAMACTVETGYECDTVAEPSVCTPVCGDGVVVAGVEACDDGNTDPDDGCDGLCVVETGFVCDGSPSACSGICGDALIVTGEACDDGNEVGNDGCSPRCSVEFGATCDNATPPSVCTTTCGDGIPGFDEQCDDTVGTPVGGDGCSTTCQFEPGFVCLGAPSDCRARCGDGRVDGDETCDDGNGNGGDGCSTTCQVEFAHTCTGTPSVCTVADPLDTVSLHDWGGCILTVGGAVGCFGDNVDGAVGNGDAPNDVDLPTATGITDATAITAGLDHACAIRSTTNDVWCWGDNVDRSAGGTTSDDFPVPTQLAGSTGAVAIAAGDDHTCLIDGAGAVLCWGDNSDLQLGRGTSTTDGPTPVAVTLPGTLTATAVAGGEDHTCALLSDTTVACWGDDADGQVGDGAVGGGDVGTPTVVVDAMDLPVTGFTAIEAGGNNSCGINGGQLYCWGENTDFTLADGTTTDRSEPTLVTFPDAGTVDDVAVGDDFVCALLSNETVYCWGEAFDFQLGNDDDSVNVGTPTAILQQPAGPVREIEAGENGMCLITDAGVRFCWSEATGRLGIADDIQSTFEPVTFPSPPVSIDWDIEGTQAAACAALTDGSVACWGNGQTISTGSTATVRGLLIDTNSMYLEPTVVGGFTTAREVAMGDELACVRTDTDVQCWGDNPDGQLGNGTTGVGSQVPVVVSALGAVDEIGVGEFQACARTGGVIDCWGEGTSGQLGNGGTVDQDVPTRVSGITDAVQFDLGEEYGCARTASNQVFCWGDGDNGQQGDGANADNLTPAAVEGLPAGGTIEDIACSDQTACALVDGEVWCWGDDAFGNLGQGTTGTDSNVPVQVLGLADMVELEAGWNYMCAVRSDGVMGCWGYGEYAQLGNGGDLFGAASVNFDQAQLSYAADGAPVDEVAAGNANTCIRQGTAWSCIGRVSFGQTGIDVATRPPFPRSAPSGL